MEQKVFKDNGQPPIEPPEGDGNIPQELMGIVAIKEEKKGSTNFVFVLLSLRQTHKALRTDPAFLPFDPLFLL